MKDVVVIGSGLAGISAAACLAREGFRVTVLEKNSSPGGRARYFSSNGFTFDMGPSWYWMPDIFESFFQLFGKRVSDFYTLKRLDPSYRIFYGKNDFINFPAGMDAISQLFESLERGSSTYLRTFLDKCAYKYERGMHEFVYLSKLSWKQLTDLRLLTDVRKLNLFQTHASYVRKFFKHPRILGMLQFPVLFLGAPSEKIPALYSLMNYADIALGTWYPMGGMWRMVEAMVKIAEDNGVGFNYDHPVSHIIVKDGAVTGVESGGKCYKADYVVAAADYRHVEQDLLRPKYRQYTSSYWEKRVLAPSCLIFYIGLRGRLENLGHHTLFFDGDIQQHTSAIYENARWPSAPHFYVCAPSKTDPSVAPPGCENLFILVPIAAGLQDEESTREKYFKLVVRRIEELTGELIHGKIIFKRSYAHNDFTSDYNAFKGNAYGLANTLLQTANFRPGVASTRVQGLYFAGQFTVPGPGVPPAIISGQVSARAILEHAQRNGFFSTNEKTRA